jgi:PPM family protein phosphatase
VWVVASSSHPGRVRERNEDSVSVDRERGVIVVADGLGGHAAGDVASRLVTTTLVPLLRTRLGSGAWAPEAAADALAWAVRALSAEIVRGATEVLGLDGMGATVVAAVLFDEEAVIGHLGDSRAYLWRSDALTPLTRDHSLLRLLSDAGQGSDARSVSDLRESPSVITRYVGMPGEPLPEIARCRTRAGDRLLLCTDGCTAELDDGRLRTLLGMVGSPDELCRRLVEAALASGGSDNVTVAVAERTGSGTDAPVEAAGSTRERSDGGLS